MSYKDLDNSHRSNKYDPISYITFGRVGNTEDGEGYRKVMEVRKKRRVDDTGTYTYLGFAVPGTPTSEAKWQISRITNATGDEDHADGNLYYDNIWDNRASLSYS